MSLETLPNELKLDILKGAPDVSTLFTLVHASPVYHSLYANIREECLTEVTLRELEGRKVDVRTPYSFIEVCTRGGGPPPKFLKSAIEDCYIQTQKGQDIKLSVGKCRILRTLTDLVGWTIDWNHDGNPPSAPRVIMPCNEISSNPIPFHPSREYPFWVEVDRRAQRADYQFDFRLYHFIRFNIGKFPKPKPKNPYCVRLVEVETFFNDEIEEEFDVVECYFRVKR